MVSLVGLTSADIAGLPALTGCPGYRAKQVADWVYRRFAGSVAEMTNLPASLVAKLAESCTLFSSTIDHADVADDGTVKYLLRLADGEKVECVYLPYEARVSVCLSSQVGCPAGCTFCATAKGGLVRNMTSGEIVEQVLQIQREQSHRRISHAVFMGMGEPLFNVENVVSAIRILHAEIGLSARHITVSTVGVPPGIEMLAEQDLPLTLALSLHAPDDELRRSLIPTARKWSLAEILESCRMYRAKTGRDMTFEYLLLGGVNDSEEQAAALAVLLRGIPGNVNLIPFNYVETPEGFRRPEREQVAKFRQALEVRGRRTTQRMVRGRAISAACGQLRSLRSRTESPGALSLVEV